jgi:hypothetical protein
MKYKVLVLKGRDSHCVVYNGECMDRLLAVLAPTDRVRIYYDIAGTMSFARRRRVDRN